MYTPNNDLAIAGRLLVAAVKSVARAYRVSVDLTNTAPDAAVRSAYRKVYLRAHPDKEGGSMDHAQRLFAAWYEEPSPSRLH